MNELPCAIIVDLDGTLCINDQGRSSFDYYAARHDAVNPAVAEILYAFMESSPSVQILFVSGREDYSRIVVEEWMTHHLPWLLFPPYRSRLYMRKSRDFRDDVTVKLEIYENKIKPFWDVLFVLDDRNKVVKMWREQGLTCLQVAEGNF